MTAIEVIEQTEDEEEPDFPVSVTERLGRVERRN